jgi:hypothetical protein
MFGKINAILASISSVDPSSILNILGTPTDTSSANTIFGDINSIQGTIGTSSGATDVFAQMDIIQSFAQTAKSNAGAAYATAQNIESDLGVNGRTPTVDAQLKILEGYIKDIQVAAMGLGGKQDAMGEVSQQLIGLVKDLMNQQATGAGLGGSGLALEGLGQQQARDAEKVSEKLDEMDAKIRAIYEAMNVDDVIVKTWFTAEGEEGGNEVQP